MDALEALSWALVDAGEQARIDLPGPYVKVDRIKARNGWRPWWERQGRWGKARASDAVLPKGY